MLERNVSKGELGICLRKKPKFRTSITYKFKNEPSYGRYGCNNIFAGINPVEKRVITVYPYNDRTLQKAIKKENKIYAKYK